MRFSVRCIQWFSILLVYRVLVCESIADSTILWKPWDRLVQNRSTYCKVNCAIPEAEVHPNRNCCLPTIGENAEVFKVVLLILSVAAATPSPVHELSEKMWEVRTLKTKPSTAKWALQPTLRDVESLGFTDTNSKLYWGRTQSSGWQAGWIPTMALQDSLRGFPCMSMVYHGLPSSRNPMLSSNSTSTVLRNVADRSADPTPHTWMRAWLETCIRSGSKWNQVPK